MKGQCSEATATALEAEIGREVEAYAAEGLVVVVRSPGRVLVAPESEKSRMLAGRMSSLDVERTLDAVTLPESTERFRVVRVPLGPPGDTLELGMSLAELESTLAQFDRRVAGGGMVFLVLAVLGGLFLSGQALRPVALSIVSVR